MRGARVPAAGLRGAQGGPAPRARVTMAARLRTPFLPQLGLGGWWSLDCIRHRCVFAGWNSDLFFLRFAVF